MDEKWHRSCGGKVVYREPSEKGVGFEQAGYCLKCDAYPIKEENIIFKLENGMFERLNEDKYMNEDKWEILEYNDLPEKLDGIKPK